MQAQMIAVLNLVFIVSSSLVFSSSFVLAANFEGVIHMKSTFGASVEGRGGESDWYIKGDSIRTERRGTHDDSSAAPAMGGMIFDAGTQKAYLIMPERKMYMELSERSLEKGAEHLRDMKYEIVRTGNTDKVAGYQCDIFQTRSKDTGKIHGEACAAKGLANMGAFMGLNRSSAVSGDFFKEVREIIKEGYFLLRMVRKNDDGSEKMRMEATSVEKKKLDDGLFRPPADYTKFDMSAIKNKRKDMLEEGGKGEGSHNNVDSAAS